MPYAAFDLHGKVALVTGGNGGIGLGMAQALADAGADVAIWGTNAVKNANARADLSARGVRALALEVDVAEEASVRAAFEDTVAELGRVDAVFANAGIRRTAASFIDITEEDYRRVLAVNLDGVYYTFRAAAAHMKARYEGGDRSGGSLIGIASLAAIEGAARNQHYAATKGAVISMIKACAVELARYSVRANAILPGWIATEMTQEHQDAPKFVERVIGRVPVRRWGEPADFGGIAVYLASDASSYQTGSSVLIDGGYAVY